MLRNQTSDLDRSCYGIAAFIKKKAPLVIPSPRDLVDARYFVYVQGNSKLTSWI